MYEYVSGEWSMVSKWSDYCPPLAGEVVRLKNFLSWGGNKLNRIVVVQECDATKV